MKKINFKNLVIILTGIFLVSCASTTNQKSAVKGRPEPVRNVAPAYAQMPEVSNYINYTCDPNTTFQTIEGFGGAYTWYSDWLFNNGNDGSAAFDSMFSNAKMNIIRFKNEFEYNSKNKADNGETIRKIYEGAVERFAEFGEKPVVLMCCWSPAAYLKSNNEIHGQNGATLKKNADGQYCYEEYADWWTRAIKYYNSLGVKIDYVSIQNEVEFVASYDGCRFDAFENSKTAGYGKAFCAVYRAFKKEFGEDAPKLLAPETMSCMWSTIAPYIKAIEAEEKDAVAGIAHHLYVGGNANEADSFVDPGSFITNFMDMGTRYENRRKWQTEYFIGHAIQQAELINNCLTYENVNAYIFWSAVWNTNNNQFEKADLASLYWNGTFFRKAKYYVMRHFSEYIRPGYTRIKAISGTPNVRTSAYLSPDGKTMTVVLINVSDEKIGYTFNSSAYKTKSFHAYQSVFGDVADDEDACWIDRGEFKADGKISLWPKSVTTVVINGSR